MATAPNNATVGRRYDPPFLFVRPRTRFERAAKRTLDIVGASLALAALSPLLCLSLIAIKLSGRGPVIHRRRVLGQRGQFDAFKLRTMRVDADLVLQQNRKLREEYEQNFKLRNDPRVTRIGKVLRKYSLDELPQLFNVLRGDMSLVGPRMITARELPRYGNRQDLFTTVKPGLTGYWQIHGRQQTSYSERVEMDTYYIQNWSLFLDLKILFATPIQVLKGEGAY